MSNKRKEKKKGFWTKYAEQQIKKNRQIQVDAELFLLSEKEIQILRSIRIKTFVKAGIAGTLGVLLLYVPYHLFGEALFPMNHIWIPGYEEYVDLEVLFLIYSTVLVFIEIWYLTFINVKAVSSIADVCGHPNPIDENYDHNVNALIAVGLEKKQKELKAIGIDPYEGLSKVGVVIFQFLLKLKATASNMLFRVLVKKVLGRYALRLVLDLAGIPVYAFWNILGARKVMNEARVRVMAPPLIKRCSEVLFEEQKDNPEFIKHIYDTLQLISESKRSFHYNHFLLSITMLNKFGIEVKEEPVYNEDFLEEIPTLSAKTRDGIEKLFIFGIMIDGRLSYRERKAIRYLKEKNVLEYKEEDIVVWSRDYFNGRGIEAFFAA
ncbi:MAG: hypothetical protein H6582_05735 [Crocinitomicaceae bacterium]|nr:hypothetical protein [Crocinitomicaceae bacterium]